ncbi:hypothetical protein Aduo_006683 [Ancylostoma duodenale]
MDDGYMDSRRSAGRLSVWMCCSCVGDLAQIGTRHTTNAPIDRRTPRYERPSRSARSPPPISSHQTLARKFVEFLDFALGNHLRIKLNSEYNELFGENE